MSYVRIACLWSILLTMLLVSACGGDADDSPEATSTTSATAAASPTAAATATEAAAPEPSATSAPSATPVPPTSTAVPTETPIPAISNEELTGIAEAIFPEVTDGVFVGCDTLANAECPVTDRLKLRLSSDSFVRLCRCQTASGTRAIEPQDERLDDGGGIVRVTLYEGNTSYDLVVIAGDSGWLLDDQYCSGRPETSIYTDASPC